MTMVEMYGWDCVNGDKPRPFMRMIDIDTIDYGKIRDYARETLETMAPDDPERAIMEHVAINGGRPA